MKRWKPKSGDTYWYVNHLFEVEGATWIEDGIDEFLYKCHNCFKTIKQAKKLAVLMRKTARETSKELHRGYLI